MSGSSSNDTTPSWMSYALSIPGVASISGAAMLYFNQCDYIYPADFPPSSRSEVPKPSDFGLNFTEKMLITKDNVKLHTYLMTLEDEEEAKKAPTILIFHGNAGNMGQRLPIARVFYRRFKCNVAMLSYRGYGKSEGKPNEKGIRIDSRTFLEYVRSHRLLKNTRLVAYGQSLGGAVAIDLVSHYEDAFSGLIVENTFLSMQKLIPHIVPPLRYATFLCHQVWPSDSYIQRIARIPVLFLSGAQDELIPPSHMAKLHEICNTRDAKEWVSFESGMHNDTCMQPGYFVTVQQFLERNILKKEQQDTDRKRATKVTETIAAEASKTKQPPKKAWEPYQLADGIARPDAIKQSFRLDEIKLDN